MKKMLQLIIILKKMLKKKNKWNNKQSKLYKTLINK